MAKKRLFTGCGTALVTPFRDGAVDYAALDQLIDWQIAEGADALVVAATTGEGATLSHEEHVECIDFCVRHIAGRVPVIAGTGSNDTAYSLELSREAAKSGADGLLLVSPYYNKCTQAGLIAHFLAVADTVDLPVIIYNVPSRTNLPIAPATVIKLAEHPNIVGLKEAGSEIKASTLIAAGCAGKLDIYSGNDENIVPLMAIGAIGVISVLSNLVPRELHNLCSSFLAGDLQAARSLQLKYIKLVDLLFCEPSPIPVKRAMQLMGLDSGELRLPLTPMEPQDSAKLEAEMRALGLIGK